MAGHLKKHPFLKSWDELQRTKGRMETYLDMNWTILPDDEKETIQIMIEAVEKAMRQVPKEHRITKHFQYKDK